jgi:hypothetical protein
LYTLELNTYNNAFPIFRSLLGYFPAPRIQ